MYDQPSIKCQSIQPFHSCHIRNRWKKHLFLLSQCVDVLSDRSIWQTWDNPSWKWKHSSSCVLPVHRCIPVCHSVFFDTTIKRHQRQKCSNPTQRKFRFPSWLPKLIKKIFSAFLVPFPSQIPEYSSSQRFRQLQPEHGVLRALDHPVPTLHHLPLQEEAKEPPWRPQPPGG